MRSVIGIDEAGYSPLLGPLVVSAAHFRTGEIPDDWWAALRIPRAREETPPGLPAVDDSKKLYTPARGLARLELGVLAFLGAAGRVPATFRELLALIGAGVKTNSYPWYRDADHALPVAATMEDVARAAEAVRHACDRAGVRFAGFRCAPLLVAEYNDALDQSGNKSIVLFRTNAGLIDALLEDEADAVVFADKHGGRNFYGKLLAQHYFGAHIRCRAEKKQHSAYCVRQGGRRIEISFHLRGDSVHLPIALASMCSKYVRELFMGVFNAYWAALAPGLRRTSGYGVDARRFIAGIRHLPESRTRRTMIVRSK